MLGENRLLGLVAYRFLVVNITVERLV